MLGKTFKRKHLPGNIFKAVLFLKKLINPNQKAMKII